MAQNFIYLSSHRTYVSALYRHTLRNAHKCCYSVHLRNRVKKVVKEVILKHRYDKSSWSIYSMLHKMKKLNEHLNKRELKKVWSILTPFTKQKKPLRSLNLIKELKNISNSTNHDALPSAMSIREREVLKKYINRKQEVNGLPHFIPNEYKLKLLLPIALHEDALLKLGRIEHQLSKGPPRVVLSHTSSAGGQMWFLRSALNKGKRQSKALGTLLRQEKKKAQKRLNDLGKCKDNAKWALHEAIWEQSLDDGTIPVYSLEKYLDALTPPMSDVNNNRKSSRKEANFSCPLRITEWLEPIAKTMNSLERTTLERAAYFKDYKNRVLLNGGLAKNLEVKSDNMYAKRVRRFKSLVKNEIPLVVPFVPGRELPTLLAKYRLK